MMSGFGTIASVVEAIKKGAENFTTKPFEGRFDLVAAHGLEPWT